MARGYKHKECFDAFGVSPRNARWSWSGRSDDGAHVAVTLWKDRFEDKGRTYRSWRSDRPGEWTSRPGFVELIANLVHARDHLGGRVHVILAVPKDDQAKPRSIEQCFPQPNLKMRVAELDEREGARSRWNGSTADGAGRAVRQHRRRELRAGARVGSSRQGTHPASARPAVRPGPVDRMLQDAGERHPVGTRFRMLVKLTDRAAGGEFLYSFHGWKVDVLGPPDP